MPTARRHAVQALCALVLFAGAASSVAFTPHAGGGRQRRGAGGAGGAGAGASASAGAFASSGSAAHGGGGGGGAGGFAFPDAYGPSSFENAFRTYFSQMEAMLAAQQAHAQALSNRIWHDWQNNVASQAQAAQHAQAVQHAQAANVIGAGGFGGGYGGSYGGGYGGGYGGFSPQYFQYGTPQASHAHTAISFFPHRFNNAGAANSLGNNVDQGSFAFPSSATQYSSVSTSNGAGGGGYGTGFSGAGSYGGSGGFGFPGGSNAGAPYHGGSSSGGGGGGAGGAHVGGGLGGAAQGAQASLSVNNRGGFGEAQLFPDPNLTSRIGGDVPPLSGGNFGVFSSSSSSSHSDPSGKTTTFKQATVGVNDNGKVTTFSVKDP